MAVNPVSPLSPVNARDTDDAIRRARFGRLPERIRFEDMTQEVVAVPGQTANIYDPEGAFKHYSCLALDLGL
ncbi:hypothetical protein [Streptomyces sp. NPDC007856]|uniref:hypothetical protein n=1 Tax=Streptomyces sp. NPDC007856 TaxID=3364781 RepID=UPI00368CE93D